MGRIRARLIYNPMAGLRDRRQEVQRAVHYLTERGWSVDWCETRAGGEATYLAREAVRDGAHAVVVAGGDGTINEAINGLAGSDVALGVLPAGRVNVWALEIGIPLGRGLIGAAKILAEGKTRRIDLGQAGDRLYILAAGAGFDAQIAKLADADQRLGKFSLVSASLRTLASHQGTWTRVVLDGEAIEDDILWIVLGNLQRYAGVLRIATQARLDDGLLDVVLFRGRSVPASLPAWPYILSQGRWGRSQVDYYQVREAEVQADEPMPVHVDAEFLGHTPLTFRAVPQALRVLVPAELPPRLFADPRARGCVDDVGRVEPLDGTFTDGI
jgi:diacylglycerol kinase (ATP)